MASKANTPPVEMLADESLSRMYEDGTNKTIVMIKDAEKRMLWGLHGLSGLGEAYMASLKSAAAGPAKETAVIEPAKTIATKPAHVYLNNQWALFTVDGREYTRDEFRTNRLNGNLISQVRYPASCKNCLKPWSVEALITETPAEVVVPFDNDAHTAAAVATA